MNEVEKICDEVAIISNGSLIEQGDIKEILNSKDLDLEKHFLELTEAQNV